MTTYAPTVSPGDVRRRTRFIGIWVPLDERTPEDIAAGVAAPAPLIQVLEQDVIRTKDGSEKVLADLGTLPHTGFQPDRVFPVRDLVTDEPTGETATMLDVMALVQSWVRDAQDWRDAREVLPAPVVEGDPHAAQ